MQEFNPRQRSWEFMENVITERGFLDNPGIIDGDKTWTFKEMFEDSRKYAAMFSALGITEENSSRVMILSTCSSQSIFFFFALDMTGAVASFHHKAAALDVDTLRPVVESEGITDIIFWDALFRPNQLTDLAKVKAELGIRHILTFHCDLPKEIFPFKLRFGNRLLKNGFRKVEGLEFIEDALAKYGNHEISYAKADCNALSLITHTSGTSNGLPKAIPFTDLNRNAEAITYEDFDLPGTGGLILYYVIPSAAYGSMNNLFSAMYMGYGQICLHAAFIMPDTYGKIMTAYKPNCMLVITHFMDTLMTAREADAMDFSAMHCIGIGGSKISRGKMEEYRKFFTDHGSKALPFNGYGLSEAGGSCILDRVCNKENGIGKPFTGVDVRIFDKESQSYKTMADAPVEGEMFISSLACSSGKLDNTTIFESVEIDGKMFVPTKDLARFEEDGTISMLGRNSRGFQNFVCFNVYPEVDEASLTSLNEVAACVIVPEYSEKLHGNLTKLYLETAKDIKCTAEFIKNIIWTKYKNRELIAIPDIVVPVSTIPRNDLGKLNVHKVAEEGLPGKRYRIKTIGGVNVTGIEVVPE